MHASKAVFPFGLISDKEKDSIGCKVEKEKVVNAYKP